MTALVAVLLQLNAATAAEWWVEEEASVEVLAAALVDLWPGRHEVRIGAGEGFVLANGMLTWVGPLEVRTERVGGLREAVALGRSWEQSGQDSSVGWVPERARALPPQSSVELGDLDSRTPGGMWFLGAVLDLRYGPGFGIAFRREGAIRFGAAGVLTPSFWGSLGEPSIGVGMAGLDLQSFIDWDVAPGPVQVALGAAVSSHHQHGPIAGLWVAVRPTVELGVDLASIALAARVSHPVVVAWRARGPLARPGTRIGAVVRSHRRVPFEVGAGYGGFGGTPEIWADLSVFMDLGGWR